MSERRARTERVRNLFGIALALGVFAGVATGVMGRADIALSIGIGVGLAVAAFGAYEIVRARANERLAAAAQNWPQIDATILESKILTQVERSSDNSSFESYSYAPEVRYAYRHAGTDRTGDTISFHHAWYGDERIAAKLIAPYRAGQVVKLRIDPADPTQTVLEPKSQPVMVGQIFGGVVVVAGMALAIWMAIRLLSVFGVI